MIVLSAALSEACNLNCNYCNVDKQSKKRINSQDFILAYENLRAANPDDRIQIDFYGGEPLMQFDTITEIVNKLSTENVQFFMPTNGLLLTEEKLNFLTANNVEISLSFDGLWQNTNRKQRNNKETLSLYESKKYMFRKIPNFKIHTMIVAGNYNLLENHLYISEYGANPELTLVRDIGTWHQAAVDELLLGIKELFDWYKLNTDKEMPNFIYSYFKSIVLYQAKGISKDTCGAGKTHFSFSEGKTVPCNRFKDEPETIAKIPFFTKMSPCQTCEIKNYCHKGCLYEQIHNNGPIDELCQIYKFIYKEIFKLLAELKTDKNIADLIKKEIEYEYGIRT